MSKALIILLIAAGTVIAVSIVIAVVVIANRKDKEKDTAQRSRQKQPAQPDTSAFQVAVLSEYAKLFEGLYESLYISEKDPDDKEAYLEFCERIEKSDSGKLKEAFESDFTRFDIEDETLYKYKLQTLLKLFDKAGIKRLGNAGKTFTYDDRMKDVFASSDGKPVSGQKYTIIKPAWVKDGKVVENGMMILSE